MKRILSVFLALALLLGLLPAAALAEEAGAANVFILPSGLQAVEDEAFAGNTTLGTLISAEYGHSHRQQSLWRLYRSERGDHRRPRRRHIGRRV